MDTKIVKPSEANIFLEGVEVCREYFHTEKITFGTSELQPGQTGAVDNGHKDSHEVFYVAKGHVLLRCGVWLHLNHRKKVENETRNDYNVNQQRYHGTRCRGNF